MNFISDCVVYIHAPIYRNTRGRVKINKSQPNIQAMANGQQTIYQSSSAGSLDRLEGHHLRII